MNLSLPLRALALLAFTLFFTGATPTRYHWTFKVFPPEHGSKIYFYEFPSNRGDVATGDCDFNFTAGNNVYLNFTPANGYTLTKVIRDGNDITATVLASGGTYFISNVSAASHIEATFSPRPPGLGTFEFGFPGINPELTPLLYVSGHYDGAYGGRNYSLDVTQDDGGKLRATGSVDGVKDARGNSTFSGPIGSIATVDGAPVAKLHGSFTGTVDGVPGSAVASGTIPSDNTVTSTGDPGVIAHGQYSGRIAGFPFSGKGDLDIPFSQAEFDNIKKNWTLQLHFEERINAKNKKYLVASGAITLPNGEQIVFAERTVRHPVGRGYTFVLKRGLNQAHNPPDVAKGTVITLTKLQLYKDAPDQPYQIYSGIVNYKFFGQRGRANASDLVFKDVDFVP